MTKPDEPTVMLPADLLHRVLDRLEEQERKAKRPSRVELAALGLCVLGILVDSFLLEPVALRRAGLL